MRLLGVRSRHVARFLDAYEYDEYAVVIADYCEGERLCDRVRRSGPLGAALSLNVALQICLGIEHFHAANVVHGRLNPRHVLTQTAGKSEVRVTIISFGLAQGLDRGIQDGYGPEAPAMQNTPRGDIFTIGAILFEMLTGSPPSAARNSALGFDALSSSELRNPAELNPALARSPALCDIVGLLTSPDAQDLRIGDVISRLDRLRTTLNQTPAAVESTVYDSDVFNAPDTGFSRTKTDIRKRTTVAVGGEDYNVHLRGSVLKLRPLSRGRSWGPEALRFDLREYGFDVDLTCVTSIDEVIWFGTADGQVGRITADTGIPESMLKGAKGEVTSICGRKGLIVAGCREGQVFYRRGNGDFHAIDNNCAVTHVSVSERSSRFAVGHKDGTVRIYEVKDDGVDSINHFTLESLTGLRLSVDGRQVAVSENDATLVRDVRSGERIGSVGQMSELIDTAEILRAASRLNK